MHYNDFLHRLITLGIESARKSYGGGGAHDVDQLTGSIDGFMECRGLQPEQIAALLAEARRKTQEAFVRASEREIPEGTYWRLRSREAEIEWMANCVSIILVNQGLEPIVPPTVRAALTVASIVGVASPGRDPL